MSSKWDCCSERESRLAVEDKRDQRVFQPVEQPRLTEKALVQGIQFRDPFAIGLFAQSALFVYASQTKSDRLVSHAIVPLKEVVGPGDSA